MNYQEYLQSNHWQMTRLRKLAKAGHRCESCRETTHLEVHHLTYKTLGKENESELIVLCSTCHEYTHLLWKKPPDDFGVAAVRSMLFYFLPRNVIGHRLRCEKTILQSSKQSFKMLPEYIRNFYAISMRAYFGGIKVRPERAPMYPIPLIPKTPGTISGSDRFHTRNEYQKMNFKLPPPEKCKKAPEAKKKQCKLYLVKSDDDGYLTGNPKSPWTQDIAKAQVFHMDKVRKDKWNGQMCFGSTVITIDFRGLPKRSKSR